MYRATAHGSIASKWVPLEARRTTVLNGGTLIDGTGGPPLPGAAIVIEGERIVAVGRPGSMQLPDGDGVRTVNTTGRFIIPGLINCHVHLTGTRSRGLADFLGQPKLMAPLKAALTAHDVLQAGFTTVRVLGHGSPHVPQALKQAINAGSILGPRILTSSWSLAQSGGAGNRRSWPLELEDVYRPHTSFADGVDACRTHVRRNFGEGADCIKIFTTEGDITTFGKRMNLPNFRLEEIEAITDEAHRLGLRVASNATGVEGVVNAVKGGVDTIEHGALEPEFDWLKLLRDGDRVLVPTFMVFHRAATAWQQYGYSRPVGERAQRWYEIKQEALRRANELGVKIALGSDGSGGDPQELSLMVDAGLSPMEAIVAATRTAAAALGLDRQLGTIEPGKLADMLVLAQDPTADITCLEHRDNIVSILKTREQLTRT